MLPILFLLKAVIRVSDPFIWNEIRSVWNRNITKAKAPLNSFLNSAVNIELVYLTLTAVGISLSNLFGANDQQVEISKEAHRTKIKIKNVVMDNRKNQWDVRSNSYINQSVVSLN
jgi:hypothetical protein